MIESSGTRRRPGNGRSPLGPGKRRSLIVSKGSNAVRLRITLKDIEPAPWRVVDAPLSLTLGSLENVIQAVFCWWNYHLWEFQVRRFRVAIPDEEDEWNPDARPFADARRFPLSRCLTWGVDRMNTLYDFGDDWNHDVRLETVFRVEDLYSLPAFVEGAWAAPAGGHRRAFMAVRRVQGRGGGPVPRGAGGTPRLVRRPVRSREHPRRRRSARGWRRSGATGWRRPPEGARVPAPSPL